MIKVFTIGINVTLHNKNKNEVLLMNIRVHKSHLCKILKKKIIVNFTVPEFELINFFKIQNK